MKLGVVILFTAGTAFAQPAVPPNPRPQKLTLPARTLSVSLTIEANASEDKVGEPVSIAPDLSYGVTDELTVSVVHSFFATTGFRARAGSGLCVTGTDGGCPEPYNNLGAEALWSLRPGRTSVAVIGGVFAMDLEQGYYDAKVGARARHVAGALSVQLSPSVLVALTEREDPMGNRANKDLLFVPVVGTYKPWPALGLSVGSGIKGSLTDLGATWELPVGLIVQYAVSTSVSVGSSLVFGKLLGGADDPPPPAPPATGPESRGVNFWLTWSRGT